MCSAHSSQPSMLRPHQALMRLDVEEEDSEQSGGEATAPPPSTRVILSLSDDELVDSDSDDVMEQTRPQRSSDAASHQQRDPATPSPLLALPPDVIELDVSPSSPASDAALPPAAAVASSSSSSSAGIVEAAEEKMVSIACWNCSHQQPCATEAAVIQCDKCSLPINNPNAAVVSVSSSSSASGSAAGDELQALLESCCVCGELLVSSPLCFLACGHLIHEHHKYITLRSSCAACCPPSSSSSSSSSSSPVYSAKDVAYRPSAAEAAHYRQKKESEKLRYGSERGPAFPLFLDPAEVARLLVYGEDGDGDARDRRSMEERLVQLQREVAEAQAEQAALQQEEQTLQEEKVSTERRLQDVQSSVQRRQGRHEQSQQRTVRLQRQTYALHRSLMQMERDIQLLTEEMSRHAEEQQAVMKEDPVDWSDGEEEQKETAEEGGDAAAETARRERRERRQRQQLRHAQPPTAGSEWRRQQRDRWQHMQMQVLRYRDGRRERQEAEEEARSAEEQLIAARREQRQEQQELERLEAELQRERQAWDRERKAEEKLQMQRDKKRKNDCRTAPASAGSGDKAAEEQRDLTAQGLKRRQAGQAGVKEKTLQLLDGAVSPSPAPASLSASSRSSSSLPFQLSLPSSTSVTAKSSLRPVTPSVSFPSSRFPSFQSLPAASLASSTSLAPIPGSGSFLRTGPDGRGGTVSVGRTGSGLCSVLSFPSAAVRGAAGTGAGRRAEQPITAFLQSARLQ